MCMFTHTHETVTECSAENEPAPANQTRSQFASQRPTWTNTSHWKYGKTLGTWTCRAENCAKGILDHTQRRICHARLRAGHGHAMPNDPKSTFVIPLSPALKAEEIAESSSKLFSDGSTKNGSSL